MTFQLDQMVFHYKIIRKIASGGMGDVYLAEDTKLNRQVALKVLSSSLAENLKFKEMFVREAQAAACVAHPHIVTIYEIIEFENCPIIIMEYVAGETLQSILEREQLSQNSIIEIIIQICSALEEAHTAGIIHRDIKSTNIILDQKGQIRILDFGLAGASKDFLRDNLSQSSGTLGYMSPEQIQGGEITYVSDLFSLGVLFYQMLTAQLPFQADYEAATKYAIVNDQPESIQHLNSTIDEDVEKIVFKLLEKNPNERFQKAKDVINALESSEPEMSASQRSKLTSRNFLIAASVIVIFIALFFILFNDSPRKKISGKIMLAVLPFENLGAGEDEYFSDRMTDALTSNLFKIDNIGIISRRSAMLYKNSALKMTKIGEELDVHYLLTGKIHWSKNADNKIRIYTDLIDTENGINVWTNHYDCSLQDFFNVQTSITQEVTKELDLVLSEIDKQDLTEVPSINLAAYDLYLQGDKYFHRSWGKNDIDYAIQFYKDAIALDSNFADAYAMLSRCYSSLYWDYYDHSKEACIQSKQLAEKSIALQKNQAKSFEALGYYYYHCEKNFDTALVIFSKGLDIHLNNSDLYNAKAAILRRLGRFDESCENFRYAYRLDPRSHLKAFDIALTYGMMRKYDSSGYYAQKSISLAPDYSFARIYYIWLPIIKDGNIGEAKNRLVQAREKADLTSSKYYWWLLRTLKIDELPKLKQITPGTDSCAYYLYTARSHRLKKNYKAEKIYSDSVLDVLKEKILADPNDAKFNSSMGLAYAGLRNKEKAFYYLQQTLEILESSKESFDSPMTLMDCAEIQMIFGNDETAIELLKVVTTNSGFFSENYFNADPLWQRLLEKESFKKLFKSTNN